MSDKKRRKISWGTRVAHLLSFIFLLLMVTYYCLDLDFEKETIYFNYQLLPRCAPFLLLYLLLECWLFPMYVRTRRVARYILVSLAFVIGISVVWSFFIRPMMPPTDSERLRSEASTSDVYLDTKGQQLLQQWIDSSQVTGTQAVDSCKTYTQQILEANDEDYQKSLPALRWIFCLILCLTLFLVFTTINVVENSYRIESERKRMEKEKMDVEMKLLKYQLNPHFLMNTLNNIHALIEDDSEAAQEAVRLLSKLMRYMYYENSQERVPLAKDVEALRSYFELMKLRFIDSVDLQFVVPEEIPNVQVAPNLFVNLAENAMKHGVSYGHSSFVHFSLDVDDQYVCCQVRNSKFDHSHVAESTGFGLETLKKRMDLLYPKQYLYEVEETDNEYFVELKIPVQ